MLIYATAIAFTALALVIGRACRKLEAHYVNRTPNR